MASARAGGGGCAGWRCPDALVLGGGGLVGIAYHAGALRALEREAGVRPSSARLVVGTSAGAVVAAWLRTAGTAGELATLVSSDGLARIEASFASAGGLGRRLLGSSYVLARSFWRLPAPSLPSKLGRLFPAGLASMTGSSGLGLESLFHDWPAAPLWLCALDIVSGRRVVLGRAPALDQVAGQCSADSAPGEARLDLARAVRASCALPGLFSPVRDGKRVLVDGGVHSTTNLDLAAGSSRVVVVAPMTYARTDPPARLERLLRRLPTLQLERELWRVARRGSRVLIVQPSAESARLHGLDVLRSTALDAIVQDADRATSLWLASPAAVSVLSS